MIYDLKAPGNDKNPDADRIDWEKSILSNLVQYYRCFENGDKVHYLRENGLQLIINKSSGWPNFILGGKEINGDDIAETVKNILAERYPPFWIVRNNENQERLFREHGFLLVNRWAGMGMTLTNDQEHDDLPGGFSIINVENPDQMKHWFSVAEPVVLKNHRVNFEQFRKILPGKELLFFVGYQLDRPVTSASLLLSDSAAGIYLISTNPSFRMNGYGTAITKHMLRIARQSGYQRVVLHANPKAIPLYYNLGFKSFCDLNIFWFSPKSLKT